MQKLFDSGFLPEDFGCSACKLRCSSYLQLSLRRFLEDICDFLGEIAVLEVPEGQPFCLHLLQLLLEQCQDPEACICPDLVSGARLEVDCTLELSVLAQAGRRIPLRSW